jgi:tetratricopeptide (TPR) repeat protein
MAADAVDAELVDIKPVDAMWVDAEVPGGDDASAAQPRAGQSRAGQSRTGQPDTGGREPAATARETAVVPVRAPFRQRRDPSADQQDRRADPEQILSSYPWSFDPETLREQIEDGDQMWVVVDRLTDKLEYAERDAVRARLLSLRAVAERLLGELDAALEDGRAALGHAKATGELRRTAIVQARLAHVLQWRGDYADADRLYAEANSPELPARLRAEIHELAGRSAFEQGRYLEAMNHFEGALDLRKGADPDLVERIEVALDAIARRTVAEWGPYPRTRDDILGRTEPPRPLRDERTGLWGYVGAVPPRFAQAQPFADGLAWVRRPESPAWELIDETGELVVDASSGYLAAERFAEGLAWVTRDEVGGWYAIDRHNRLIVPGGFEDAKPFHHGLALIRRGGWGVIDRHGRVVVQPRYRAIVTALVDGGPIDGFTDEGLAVVDAGDRYGVVDRTGQLIVPPVHAAIVVHPVGFLVADQYGLWGALDRQGEPLIALKYKEQGPVLDEIDRLLTDARPVL